MIQSMGFIPLLPDYYKYPDPQHYPILHIRSAWWRNNKAGIKETQSLKGKLNCFIIGSKGVLQFQILQIHKVTVGN